jgi:hypothetical protein
MADDEEYVRETARGSPSVSDKFRVLNIFARLAGSFKNTTPHLGYGATPREVGVKRPSFGCRGAIARRGVGPDRFVVNPPAFSQNLHLLEREEDLTVQELVVQLRVEAFTVPRLPWTAGFDLGTC